MLSFLPPQEQKRIRRMYHVRVFVVTLGLVSALCMFASVMLLPSYYLSLNQKKVLLEQHAGLSVSGETATESQPVQQLADIRERLRTISNFPETTLNKNVLTLLSERPSSVFIKEIGYKKEKDIATVTITGIARTREALLLYKDRLEESEVFSAVTLPINFLAQDTDLRFTITATEAIPKKDTNTES